MSKFTDKAKSVLSAVAPELGMALGGPLGGMAGGMIARALGTKSVDDPATNAAIITGDSETLLKLKQANNDFLLQMEQLGIDREKLAFDDIANARQREVTVRDRTPSQLAWTIIGGFLFLSLVEIVSMIGWAEEVAKVPPEGWLLIGQISGYLANEAKQAAAYYFGSTLSSKGKDETIATIAKGP